MFGKMISLLVIVVSLILVQEGCSQDFVFPEDEELAYLSGNDAVLTERIPIYIPGRCGENMLLYPGPGDRSTWSCDCRPGFLYFPLNGTCHKAYRQGPCLEEQYVYLPLNEAVPECVENPCKIDGWVLWHGVCSQLGTRCNHKSLIAVDPKTFQVDCIPRRG